MVSAIEKRENDLLILPWTAIKATTYAWSSIVGGSILLILLVTLPLGDVGLDIFLKFLAELREPALSVLMNLYATSFIILLLGFGWGRELAALLYPRVSACLHTPLQALLPSLTATYAIFQRTGLETLGFTLRLMLSVPLYRPSRTATSTSTESAGPAPLLL